MTQVEVEKDRRVDSKSGLPLMEAFYTLQGEGAHTGKSAYFIRLGGCDVGCHWCDVKESWDVSKFPRVSEKQIAKEAAKFPARLAVITGGEPLMHDCSDLTKELKSVGFSRHIETSGAYPVSGEWDWITFSPKKFKAPLPEFYSLAQELKVVIYNKSDFKWAEAHAAKVSDDCLLFLQPEWGRGKEMMPLIIDYVKQNPRWQVSLQTHKFMDIP